MSEHVQNNTNTEVSTMSDMLAALDDQYVEFEPQLRTLNPILETLRKDQIEFATEHRYKTMEEAVTVGQGYVALMNRQLEKVDRKKYMPLLGEVVTLSGGGVTNASMTANFSTAETTISGMVPADVQGEFNADTRGVCGYLRGISYLVGNDEYDKTVRTGQSIQGEGSYYVRLHYLVQYGTCYTPFGDLPVSSLGEIGVSKLTFEEDSQLEAIHDALTQLLSNESLEVVELVNDLNQVLSGPDLSYKQIRQIGQLVGQLHSCSALRIEDSEALLELILTYVPARFPYAISTTDAVVYPGEARDSEPVLLHTQNDTPLEYDQEISDIIFAPGYDAGVNQQDAVMLEKKEIMPYFVMEINNTIVHIPLNHIRSFGPGTY